MSTTCPSCGSHRWELVRLENRVLHVDVDTSGEAAVVERIVDDRATAGVVGATCDRCGYAADPVQVGHIQLAASSASSGASGHETSIGAA